MSRRRHREQLSPREAAVRIVRTLRHGGHTVYLAGGCVRDALLGIEPTDYDVATDAPPDRVHALLPRSRFVGEAFGVVLVRMGGQSIEVATFRTEWGYHDKRRPEHVTFTDAEHDARRRDFTINGLFADPLNTDPETGGDRIIDYVGGRADLKAGLIRAIGDPAERFGEDYLRLLRAVRFAARLDFAIEETTAAAIRPLAPHLGRISRERIGQEVRLMLAEASPVKAARGARLMQQYALDGPALGEETFDIELPTLERLGEEATYPTRLAAWMLDRHVRSEERTFLDIAMFGRHESAKVMKRWRNALCLSNDQRDELRHVLALVSMAEQWPQMRVSLRKRLLAEPHWPQALVLLRALPVKEDVARIESESRPLLVEGVAPEPLVDGDDLIALGLEPGPDFRRLLDGVYDAQLEGQVRTRAEALAWIEQHRGAE
ncbi:MAG: CCA tRNA nucleotidyltransferase [Phycisphaeraceae bacterium]